MTPHPPSVLRRVRRLKSWRATAWHEAGHAVVRLRIGLGVRDVRSTPGGEHLGVCRGYMARAEWAELGPSYWPWRRARREIMSALAGFEGERLLTGRIDHAGCDRDYLAVTDFALGHSRCEDQANRLIDELTAATRRLVEANRPAIAAVADALVAADTLRLTGRQVKAIVAGVGP